MAENVNKTSIDPSTMDKVVALAKRRGFIFPGSELYGGLANTYDYGPVGTELMRNIRNLWWETFVHKRDDVVGLEASLISHHRIWEASGHTAGFADALIDCKKCKHRMRADHLIEEYIEQQKAKGEPQKEKIHEILNPGSSDSIGVQNDTEFTKAWETGKVEGLSPAKLTEFIKLFQVPCPNCKENTGDDWTEVRMFNQLFPVNLGIVVGEWSMAYLRGETAQGMFVDFKNVMDSTRVKLPFGIAQVGKSFRNEITPGNSVFRTLVFEHAEIEFFFDPEKSNWEELFESWKKDMWEFVTQKLGVNKDNLRWRAHTDEERSFYSKRTEDLEYQFPFGFKELWGLAYRTDYDLKQHMTHSGKDLSVFDQETGKHVVPHVIEPAVGVDRLLLMVLADAYHEDPVKDAGQVRTVLKLHPRLAPYKVAVFPLLANKEELVSKAEEIYKELQKEFVVAFDDRGNIGKRYLYQDEIGTPWCVTIDFQTLEDQTVTVRDRDTAEQSRVMIDELKKYFSAKLQ